MNNKHQYITIDSNMNSIDILNYIKNNNVFLTGPPGSGKTWLTRQYIEYCNNMMMNHIKHFFAFFHVMFK